MARSKRKTPNEDLKLLTAKYVAFGAWAVPVTALIDLIKFIIKRFT